MRCPKCSIISFDNLENCSKCKADLKEVLAELQGTAFNFVAPLFLLAALQESDETEIEAGFDAFEEFEITDSDLDFMVEDTQRASLQRKTLETEDSKLSMERADDEAIEASLSGVSGARQSPSMPDELSDISDLAPPEDEFSLDDFGLEPEQGVSGQDESLDLDAGFSENTLGEDLDLDLGMVPGEEAGDFKLDFDDLGAEANDADLEFDFGLDAQEDESTNDLDMDMDLGSLGDSGDGGLDFKFDEPAEDSDQKMHLDDFEDDLGELSLDEGDDLGSGDELFSTETSLDLEGDDDLDFDLDLGELEEEAGLKDKKSEEDDLENISFSLD